MENECCTNPYMLKNWVRLLIHFVEMAIRKGLPKPYQEGDVWSGWCWLDPFEVFDLLGFSGTYDLSPGMKQIKSWFLHRLLANGQVDIAGAFGKEARRIAYSQYKVLAKNSGLNIHPPKSLKQALYNDNFRS